MLSFPHPAAVLAALTVLPPTALAQGPPVDSGRFPKLVRLLLLPEEQALLKELRNEEDRKEFQRIFWARRDPTPGTPTNEFEDGVRTAWSRADELFALPNQKGSETGCGQVLALLGRPEFIEGLETEARFNNLQATREGYRRAETWTYRDRPGQPFSFTRAELRVAFDPECRFSEGGILLQDLQRAARALVVRPEIALRRGADGRLVPLAAALPAGGASALFAAPREDFPLGVESKLMMRAPKGEAYVAGLLRATTGAAAPEPVSVAVQAVDASGALAASGAREVKAAPAADGTLVASWGLPLKPGSYKVSVAAELRQSGRASAAAIEVEVPDFGGVSLVVSPLVLYPDEPSAPGAAEPSDPYAAMQLGSMRVRPRFGNVFAPTEALTVVAALYGAKVDQATSQASLQARYSILKDGKPVARGAPDSFTTKDAIASVGPIPLAGYAAGAYLVRLDVTDAVAQQTLRQEASLEIRVPVTTR
jgi:GWxTD domain-containing protein